MARLLIFEVEADSKEEAAQIADDMESCDAIRDSFRERILDWVEPA